MKNLTCVWRNIYNTARATHSRYYKHFAKHACDFSLILLEPCNFLYKTYFALVAQYTVKDNIAISIMRQYMLDGKIAQTVKTAVLASNEVNLLRYFT